MRNGSGPRGVGWELGGRSDAHAHTHLSDGLASPAEVVREATALGLARIAITDHDCIDAHRDRSWLAVCAEPCPEVVAGVEIDCSLLDLEVEVLGYEFDPHAPVLVESLARIQRERQARFRFYCEGLVRSGESLDPEGVLALPARAPMKVHLFRALQERGRRFPGGYAEFKRLLAFLGEPPPLHRPTAAEAVRWVGDAGGLTLLAHPLYYARRLGWPAVLQAARDAGCVGVEGAYPYDVGDAGCAPDEIERELRAMRDALRGIFPDGPYLSSGTDVHDLADWEMRLTRVAHWRRVVGLPSA